MKSNYCRLLSFEFRAGELNIEVITFRQVFGQAEAGGGFGFLMNRRSLGRPARRIKGAIGHFRAKGSAVAIS